MNSTENTIKSLYALNSFYLKKLSELNNVGGNIHAKLSIENDSDDRDAYRLACKMMAQTTSIVFGYLMGLTFGDIKKTQDLMAEMISRQMRDLDEKYGTFYKNLDRD
jgi:hypothetical protein